MVGSEPVMQITIKLFANFRNGRFATSIQEFPDGTCISDVIQFQQIRAAENALCDFPDHGRIIDEHAAFHFPVLVACPFEPEASGITAMTIRRLSK